MQSVKRETVRELSTVNLARFGAIVSCLLLSLYSTLAEGACLLSYDNGAPVEQGAVLARLSAQGGAHHFAGHAEGRLGLSGDRELHLRLGGCQRSSLPGFAFEIGASQRFIAHDADPQASNALLRGPLDLSLRSSMVSLRAGQKEDSRVDIGFQSLIVMSYPFAISPQHHGAVSISAGASIATSDRSMQVRLQEGMSSSLERHLTSRWIWSEIVALSANLEVLEDMPIALELRWQDAGVIAGGSVAYLF